MMVTDPVRRSADNDDLASVQMRAFVAVLQQARAAVVSLSPADGRAGAAALSAELCQLIELHTLEAGRMGGKLGVEAELQARFLKAALADEVLLHTDWSGRAHWRHLLIEATLFGSAHAGEQVFVEIDQLLRERDPARRTVARLYLYVLALGFSGRYRSSADPAPIARYRRELFQFAWQRPADLDDRQAVLTAQAYASTLSFVGGKRLIKLSRAGAALVATLLVLLLGSEGLWLWVSGPVRAALATPAPSVRARGAALTVASALAMLVAPAQPSC